MAVKKYSISMEKKKLLFIIPWLPYPMKTGGHQALYNGIAAICRDYEVHVAFEVEDIKEYQNYSEAFAESVDSISLHPLYVEKSGAKKIICKSINFLQRIIDKYYDHKQKQDADVKHWQNSVTLPKEAFVNHIGKLCEAVDFDIIQVEMPWLISMIFALPEKAKKVFVHHEIGFVCRELQYKNFSVTPYVNAMRQFADFNEVKQLNLYDTVITLSSVDAIKLRDAGVNTGISTSFAIVDSKPVVASQLGNGKRLTFIGPDNHQPNFVGITWFLENCWKPLREADSEYTLDIIGKWSLKNQELYTKKYPGVRFLGFVDDLSQALQGSIMIVPITIGSGIRMKILEASSNGVPFVSTYVGAEGIPVESGKHCFLSDTPEDFVAAILKLKDKELQMHFVTEANRMVIDHYSQEALRRNRIEIYNQLY